MSTIKISSLIYLVLIFCFVMSCKKNSTSSKNTLKITTVTPKSGPVGTQVTIKGDGFNYKSNKNSVTFNGTAAQVKGASLNKITTTVPEGATSGVIKVKAYGNTVTGPSFNVTPGMPGITAVIPDSGQVGTKVTIKGKNFGSAAVKNMVTFNGTKAMVSSVEGDSVLKTSVPQGATSGPVKVVVNNKTATGPSFNILSNASAFGSLKATVTTMGNDIDSTGYSLMLNSRDTVVQSNGSVTFDSVQTGNNTVTLSGIALNCDASGSTSKMVTVNKQSTATVNFSITCHQTEIVFVATSQAGSSDIFSVDPYGSGSPQDITNSPNYADYFPEISPDGSKIAFTSDIGKAGVRNIYIMNSDGSNINQVTSDTTNHDISNPSWSPDGKKLVFKRKVNTHSQIFTIDTNGNNRKKLTDNTTYDFQPDWSPDGKKIVYAEGDNLYVMNADGTNHNEIYDNGTGNLKNPHWSPDGTKILFLSNEDPNVSFNQLYVIDPDGKNKKLILKGYFNGDGNWSPDGSHVVYNRYDGVNGVYRLYIAKFGSNGKLTGEKALTPISLKNARTPFWGRFK